MKKRILLILCIGFSIVNYSQNKDSITALKKMQTTQISDSSKFVIISKIAKLFEKKNKDSASFYYQKALSFSIDAKNTSFKRKALVNLGKFEFRSMLWVKSIEYFQEAIEICEGDIDKSEEAVGYNYLGYCYAYLYDENNAFENFIKSLNIFEEISDEKGIAYNYTGIGTLFYNQENYVLAQKYYSDALVINLKLKDSTEIASSYINLGNSLSDAGNIKKGLENYQKSIEIFKNLKDNISLGINYNNISDSYKELKDYKKAKLYLGKALKLAENENDKGLLSVIYLNKAGIASILNNYNLAIKYAIISNKYADEIKELRYKIENYRMLSLAYKAKGNFKKALFYSENYTKIKDSINKFDKYKTAQLFKSLSDLQETNFKVDKLVTENTKVKIKNKHDKNFIYGLIAAMVVFGLLLILLNFQYTKKQEAFNLLKYQNFKINMMHDEIEEQKNNLEKINIAKDKLFSIIGHDLRNPFNSIIGFTELLLENRKTYTEEKKISFLKIIANSSKKASELLNNLLLWANSQSGTIEFNPEKLALNEQILKVNSLLESQALVKNIKIKMHLKSSIFVSADKNMVNVILRNLISNAIKFTNKKGLIEITTQEKEDEVEVEIKDNGVGMSKEDLENLFRLVEKKSTNGTANEQGSGLGLLLVKDFVSKNKGKLIVISEINKGSTFKFTLPKS